MARSSSLDEAAANAALLQLIEQRRDDNDGIVEGTKAQETAGRRDHARAATVTTASFIIIVPMVA